MSLQRRRRHWTTVDGREVDLRQRTTKHLFDHRRGTSKRHAFVSTENSRRSGPAARRLRSFDERAVKKRRGADSQRLDERASFRAAHRKEDAAADDCTTVLMIETMMTTRRIVGRLFALSAAVCLSSCGGIQNAV